MKILICKLEASCGDSLEQEFLVPDGIEASLDFGARHLDLVEGDDAERIWHEFERQPVRVQDVQLQTAQLT